jgi:cupin fold WbuC family metalloprotein
MLEGELSVYLFDANGNVTGVVDLTAPGTGKAFSLRLAAQCWHMPVCRSEQAVFYETMTGPFSREAMNAWAPWSPDEDDEAGIAAYKRVLGIS